MTPHGVNGINLSGFKGRQHEFPLPSGEGVGWGSKKSTYQKKKDSFDKPVSKGNRLCRRTALIIGFKHIRHVADRHKRLRVNRMNHTAHTGDLETVHHEIDDRLIRV